MYPDGLTPGWRKGGHPLDRNYRRLLVVRLDNIGDMVMLSPALRALRDFFPHSEVTLMASPAGSQVAPLLPWVDDVIVWQAVWQEISANPSLDPEREQQLIEVLRRRNFDVAIMFTSFSQSPYPPAYACYMAGIPVRVAHSKEFGGSVLSHCPEPPPDSGHQVDRNLDLLRQTGIPVYSTRLRLDIPARIQQKAIRILQDLGMDPEAPYILLAPGASCSARRYDPGRFATVLRMLARQTGLPLIVVGGPREAPLLEPVTALAGKPGLDHVKSLVGLTSVPELAALIQRASLVIANNSASLHIADAFRRPMVILYSGTELEGQWKPRNSPARLLRRPTTCSPCYAFECPYEMECLDIPPQEVAAAVLELLDQEFSASIRSNLNHDAEVVPYGS